MWHTDFLLGILFIRKLAEIYSSESRDLREQHIVANQKTVLFIVIAVTAYYRWP
jgi:hypothetical protein